MIFLKYKNCCYLIILYLFLLQLLTNFILRIDCGLITVISAYIFTSILLLFAFLIIINFLEIKYNISVLDNMDDTKIVNRRKFNIILTKLKYQKIQYKFLSLKIQENLDFQDNMVLKIIQLIQADCLTRFNFQ